MQPVPGLAGAGQAVQRGALLGGKEAATRSWGVGGGGSVRPSCQGGAHTRRFPTSDPQVPQGGGEGGPRARRQGGPGPRRRARRTRCVPMREVRAHARGEQGARSLTQRVAAQASEGVAAQAPQAPEGA